MARTAPCYDPRQALMECYKLHLGPWNFTFTLDAFLKPPMWHGTVSLFKQIGHETVRDEGGRQIFEAPQEALMAVSSWDREEYDAARELLGGLFGELIANPHTQVVVNKAIFGLHWLTARMDS